MLRWETLGVVLLLASGFAGCIGSEDEVERQSVPEVDDEDVAGPELETPASLPQQASASEPTIVAGEDGALYATAPVGFSSKPNLAEGAAYLWKSTDAGESWTKLREPGLEPADPGVGVSCSCDSDVATSPDGWVYYTDWWLTGAFAAGTGETVGNYLVEASPDGGETWNKMPVTIPHDDGVDRQWLVTGEDGFVGLFYHVYPNVGAGPVYVGTESGQIQAVFSTDHGQTWSQPVTVTEEDPQTFHQISKPVNLGDGRLAMAYGSMDYGESDEFFTAPGEVEIAVSTDRGQTWDHHTIAEVPEGFDNLWAVQSAGDATGTLHVAWAARTGTNMTTYHAATPDLGESVDGPTVLDVSGSNFLPWIAAREDGQVAVGWYGSNATGDPARAPADTRWHAYLAERANATADFATAQVSEEPVKIGELCPRGAACEEDRELLDYVGLAYTDEGRLHYAFAQSQTADEAQPAEAIVHHAAEVEE
jgi:hypothetical protein